jgi:periplasmic protein TonB
MLDQLVESRSHSGETRRRNGFLLTAFTIVFSVLICGLVYSLFSYNLAMAGEKLDISSLVSPVIPPDTAPPVPERVSEPRPQNTEKAIDKFPSRAENMQSTKESPVKPPDGVSTEKNKNLARPQSPFNLSETDAPGSSSAKIPGGRGEQVGGNSIGIKPSTEGAKATETTPPPVIKKTEPKPAPTTPPIVRKTELLNGQAINLVKPQYPQPARQIRAAGVVNVQITIDENGNVISAKAIDGHPLLRQVSENAARSSKFSPTTLNGQRVKVTGVILYNFALQ